MAIIYSLEEAIAIVGQQRADYYRRNPLIALSQASAHQDREGHDEYAKALEALANNPLAPY